jgi:hypothetical protein
LPEDGGKLAFYCVGWRRVKVESPFTGWWRGFADASLEVGFAVILNELDAEYFPGVTADIAESIDAVCVARVLKDLPLID